MKIALAYIDRLPRMIAESVQKADAALTTARLQAANLRSMNPVQLAATANEVRTMIGLVGGLKARVDTAQTRGPVMAAIGFL